MTKQRQLCLTTADLLGDIVIDRIARERRYLIMSFLGYEFSDVEVTEASVDLYTESKNLRIFSNSTGASRWEWTIRFVGGYTEEMWNVFMAHYVGNKNKAFPLTVPQHWLNTSDSGTVVVGSPANSNSENISVASTDSIDIPVGRFIRIAGADKVYMVTRIQ